MTLAVVARGAGDYNGDGIVSASDYVVWRHTFGQVGPGLAADGNNNGRIDAGDLNVWQLNFGNIASLGATAGGAVPEPASGALLVTAAALLCYRRESHRSMAI